MGEACFNLHVPNDTVADIVKKIRTHIGISAEDLADRAGLDRVEVSKLENGKNKATTDRMRTALAAGFDIPRDVMTSVLDGKVSVEDAIKSIGAKAAPEAKVLRLVRPARTTAREDPYPSRREFLIMARAKKFDETVLAVLESEVCHGGDPGDEYWERRYVEAKARLNRIAELDTPKVDASDDEVKARRAAAKKKR